MSYNKNYDCEYRNKGICKDCDLIRYDLNCEIYSPTLVINSESFTPTRDVQEDIVLMLKRKEKDGNTHMQ